MEGTERGGHFSLAGSSVQRRSSARDPARTGRKNQLRSAKVGGVYVVGLMSGHEPPRTSTTKGRTSGSRAGLRASGARTSNRLGRVGRRDGGVRHRGNGGRAASASSSTLKRTGVSTPHKAGGPILDGRAGRPTAPSSGRLEAGLRCSWNAGRDTGEGLPLFGQHERT